MNNLTVIDQAGAPIAPSVIGFRLADDRVVGFRDLARISWSGLLKASAATTIAAAATAVKGAHVALAEIEYSRTQMETTLAVMQAQRDDAVRRAADAEAKARKPARWSAAERDLLMELRATGMSYAKIADRLGTGRTAGAIGAKWRALAGKPPPPAAPVAKPAKAPRKARKAPASR